VATVLRLILVAVLVSGCSLTPSPALPTIPAGATIDCGPVVDQALCQNAVAVAMTAQLNPPPIEKAWLRRPRLDDDCVTAVRPCDAGSIIVTLQSGDTLQEVPLIPTTGGWVRLDLVR